MRLYFKTVPAGFFFIFLIGCTLAKPALPPSRSVPPEATLPAVPQSIQPEKAPAKSPRAVASMELSKQARLLIEAGKPDEAIRFLERAVNLYPGSGENYYYLAEAWLLKGDSSQAAEYNTLAAVQFKDDPGWIKRITLQRNLINQISKN